jgi:hypothetical protein
MAQETDDIVWVIGGRAEEETCARQLSKGQKTASRRDEHGSWLTLAGVMRLCGQFRGLAARPPVVEARFFVGLNDANRPSYVKYWSSIVSPDMMVAVGARGSDATGRL